jgi:uncharacterized membrane protein YbhN (UPF0104 family)
LLRQDIPLADDDEAVRPQAGRGGALEGLWAGCSGALSSRWLRLCVSIGLLVLLIAWTDVSQAFPVVADARFGYLALLLLVVIADRLLSSLRLYLLLRGKHARVSFLSITRLILVSGFTGFLVPGTVGVEAVRVYGVTRMTSSLSLSVTSVLLERFLGLFALCLLVFAGLAMGLPGLPALDGEFAWAAFGLLLAGALMLMNPPLRRLSLLLLSPGWLAVVRRRLQKIYAVLDDYRQQPWVVLCSLLVALIFQLNRCLLPAIGAVAIGVSMPFLYFVTLVPVITMAELMPISIAGLGVREVAFVYLFSLAGMPMEVSLPLALLTRKAQLLPLPLGAWLYVRGGLSA